MFSFLFPTDYRSWLLPYLEGALEGTRRARLEARLAADPALAAELEALRWTAARLRVSAATPPDEFAPAPPSVWPAVRARLAVEAPRRPRWQAAWNGAGGLCAASLLVAALWLPAHNNVPALTPPPSLPAPAPRLSQAAPQVAPVPPPASETDREIKALDAAPDPFRPAPAAHSSKPVAPAPSDAPPLPQQYVPPARDFQTAERPAGAETNAADPRPDTGGVPVAPPSMPLVPAPGIAAPSARTFSAPGPAGMKVAARPPDTPVPTEPGANAASLSPASRAGNAPAENGANPDVPKTSAVSAPLAAEADANPPPSVLSAPESMAPHERRALRRALSRTATAQAQAASGNADAAQNGWRAVLEAAAKAPLYGKESGAQLAQQTLQAAQSSGLLDGLRDDLAQRQVLHPRSVLLGRMLAVIYDYGQNPDEARRQRSRVAYSSEATGEDWYQLALAETRRRNAPAARDACREALKRGGLPASHREQARQMVNSETP